MYVASERFHPWIHPKNPRKFKIHGMNSPHPLFEPVPFHLRLEHDYRCARWQSVLSVVGRSSLLRRQIQTVFTDPVSALEADIYILFEICLRISGVPVSTTRRVLRLRMEERPPIWKITVAYRGGFGGIQTPPPKFRNFDKVEPDCKLSGKCLVFLFQHPN